MYDVQYMEVILEVKAKDGIAPEEMAQTLNYLKCSGCKVGLILNFGRIKLDIKRVIFWVCRGFFCHGNTEVNGEVLRLY